MQKQENQIKPIKAMSSIGLLTTHLGESAQGVSLARYSAPNLTIQASLDKPEIMELVRQYGESPVDKTIAQILLEANKLIAEPIPIVNIPIYAQMIRQNFQDAKIEEIIIAVRDGLSGKWGPIYGKIDYPKIAEFINKTVLERFKWCQEQMNQESENNRSPDSPRNTFGLSSLKDLMRKP